MGIVYENSQKVGPENYVVIDRVSQRQYPAMLQMHYHPYYEIYVLISGKRKYFFQNRIVELYPQDVLVIKPNDPHRCIPIDEEELYYERYTINVDPSLFSRIEKNNKIIKDIFQKGVFSLEEDAFGRLLNTIKRIEDELRKDKTEYSYSIRNYIERILIEVLLYDTQIIRTNRFRKNDIRVQKALDYIVSNYDQNITRDNCAQICYMSKSNFTKVFYEVVGVNFKEYLNSVRIKKACDMLLETNLSVSDISSKVGYDNSTYFCQVFKRMMNKSPRDYRKESLK